MTLFVLHTTPNVLYLPRINTTSYDSKSIRYFEPRQWNFLDDNLRTQPDLQSFKKFVRKGFIYLRESEASPIRKFSTIEELNAFVQGCDC